MALMVAAFPILPGKTAEWREFVSQLMGGRRDEFAASRRERGIHERTFLQPGAGGDIVIVTLEGEDPRGAFRAWATADDDFHRWFRDHVRELHGFDIADIMDGPMPELVIDSEAPVTTPAMSR